LAVGQIEFCGWQAAGLDLGAKLKIDGVDIGVPAGEVAEAAVWVIEC